MNIAIASDDEKTISHHFGRARGFVIFEIENGEVKKRYYKENIGKSQGECQSCNHELMINNIKECEFVISFGMGRRIYDDLIQNNINPVVTDKDLVDEALKAFLNDELKNFSEKLH